MSTPIEDYALLSDMHTGPLVSRHGSIDWLCFPRYDSPSIFAALLGDEEHGRWLLAPADERAEVVRRRYLPGSFVLETLWRTPQGEARVTEFMPLSDRRASIVRRIEGISGAVRMRQELTMRFDYARALPWVFRSEDSERYEVLLAIVGPSALAMRGPVLPEAVDHRHVGEVLVAAGEQADFELVWYPSHRPVPPRINLDKALKETLAYWQDWADDCRKDGRHAEQVQRSLLVLRADP